MQCHDVVSVIGADSGCRNAGYWTYGPPAKDAVLHIKSIDVYFNRTSITTCGSAS